MLQAYLVIIGLQYQKADHRKIIMKNDMTPCLVVQVLNQSAEVP